MYSCIFSIFCLRDSGIVNASKLLQLQQIFTEKCSVAEHHESFVAVIWKKMSFHICMYVYVCVCVGITKKIKKFIELKLTARMHACTYVALYVRMCACMRSVIIKKTQIYGF
jgi:hypothetical protein